jgi:hypothetical protein
MSNRSIRHQSKRTLRDVVRSVDRIGTHRPAEYYGVEVEINPSDKLRLERFCKEETSYYNYLIAGFSSRVRAFPENILEFDDNWQKIFGFVAETKTRLKPLLKESRSSPLPKFLEPYRSIIFSNLTERRALLCDIAAGPGNIIPKVRHNMAIEILSFYIEQATRIMTPAAKTSNEDEALLYKVAPEMLEIVDTSRKRHLQIPKSELVVTWNESLFASEIRVGYAAYPIRIPNINLVENHNWNFILIHQQPGIVPNPSTPWMIDFRRTNSLYMLKYLDLRNLFRSASFDLNKRR